MTSCPEVPHMDCSLPLSERVGSVWQFWNCVPQNLSETRRQGEGDAMGYKCSKPPLSTSPEKHKRDHVLKWEGLPWRLSGEESTANAGDTGSIPDPGWSQVLRSKEAHAWQLLSLCSRAWELQLLRHARPKPTLHNKRRHCSEKSEHHNKE